MIDWDIDIDFSTNTFRYMRHGKLLAIPRTAGGYILFEKKDQGYRYLLSVQDAYKKLDDKHHGGCIVQYDTLVYLQVHGF